MRALSANECTAHCLSRWLHRPGKAVVKPPKPYPLHLRPSSGFCQGTPLRLGTTYRAAKTAIYLEAEWSWFYSILTVRQWVQRACPSGQRFGALALLVSEAGACLGA